MRSTFHADRSAAAAPWVETRSGSKGVPLIELSPLAGVPGRWAGLAELTRFDE